MSEYTIEQAKADLEAGVICQADYDKSEQLHEQSDDRLTKAIIDVINTKRWVDMGLFGETSGEVLLEKVSEEAVAAGLSQEAVDYLAGYAYPIDHTPTGVE